MEPNRMSVRLHLRRIPVIPVLVDVLEKLVLEIADPRRVVRCFMVWVQGHPCARLLSSSGAGPAGSKSTHNVDVGPSPFSCVECGERFWEDHPEIMVGRRTHVTRRLARQLVRDVNAMSIREVAAATGCRGISS